MIDKIIGKLLLERNAESIVYGTEEAIKEHKEQCDFLIALLEKEKTKEATETESTEIDPPLTCKDCRYYPCVYMNEALNTCDKFVWW